MAYEPSAEALAILRGDAAPAIGARQSYAYDDSPGLSILRAGRQPSWGDTLEEYGAKALHGVGAVLGGLKAGEDWLTRQSARHLYGLDVPDDATTGSLVRQGAGLSVDPRFGQTENQDSYLRRGLGAALEFGTDIATDPLTGLTMGAGGVGGAGSKGVAAAEKVLQPAFTATMGLSTLEGGKHLYDTLRDRGWSPQAFEDALKTGASGYFTSKLLAGHGATSAPEVEAQRAAAEGRAAPSTAPETWPGAQPPGFEPPSVALDFPQEPIRFPGPDERTDVMLPERSGQIAPFEPQPTTPASIPEAPTETPQSPVARGIAAMPPEQRAQLADLFRTDAPPAEAAPVAPETPPRRSTPAEEFQQLLASTLDPARAGQTRGGSSAGITGRTKDGLADHEMDLVQSAIDSIPEPKGQRTPETKRVRAAREALVNAKVELANAAQMGVDPESIRMIADQATERSRRILAGEDVPPPPAAAPVVAPRPEPVATPAPAELPVAAAPPEPAKPGPIPEREVYDRKAMQSAEPAVRTADEALRALEPQLRDDSLIQNAGLHYATPEGAMEDMRAQVEQYQPAPAEDVPFDVPADQRQAPDRRQNNVAVRSERRLAQRRVAVAEEMGLPETDPIVQRVAQAEHVANTDELTGLGNARAWAEMEKTLGPNDHVLSADAKGLKAVNDAFGHEAGNQAIKYLNDVIAMHAGEENTVRPHGDETFARLKNMTREQAGDVGRRVQEYIRQNPAHVDLSDGRRIDIPGFNVHIGIGDTLEKADADLNANAAESRATGRAGQEAGRLREAANRAEPGVNGGPEGGRQARGIQAAELAPTVDLSSVQKAFKGAKWVERAGQFETRIGNSTVRVNPDASISVLEHERPAFEASARAAGLRPEEAAPAAKTRTLGADTIVELARGAGQADVDEEAFHVAMRLALPEGARKMVLREHGFDPKGPAETADVRAIEAEERAAKAYREGTDSPKVNGAFSRISSFFRKVYRSLFPNAQTVFEDIRSGKAFEKAQGGAGESARLAARLPDRDASTMGEAIALSSPNGRMSERARSAANERLRQSLFGKDGLQKELPEQPTEAAALRRQATELRGIAERGMNARSYLKKAQELERQAASLERTRYAVKPSPGQKGIPGIAQDVPAVDISKIGTDETVPEAISREAKGIKAEGSPRSVGAAAGLTPDQVARITKQHGDRAASVIEAGRRMREAAANDVLAKLDARKDAPDKVQSDLELAQAITKASAITAETVGSASAKAAAAAHRVLTDGVRPEERFFERILRAHPAMDPKVQESLRAAVESGDQKAIIDATLNAAKPGKLKMFLEYWKNGLTSGLPTMIGNPISNAIHEALRTGERGAAGVIDAAVSKLRGTEQERFAGEMFAAMTALRSSIPDSLRALWSGLREEQIDTDAKYEHTPAIPGKLGQIVRAPGRINQAFDMAARAIAGPADIHATAFRMAKRLVAKGELKGDEMETHVADIIERVNNYGSAKLAKMAGADLEAAGEKALQDREAGMLWAKAQEAAKASTYQDEVGKLTRILMSARDEVPGGLGHVVFPFMKTPSRILAQAARRTPLGFFEAARVWKGVKEGTHTQGEFSEALARPIMGTMLGIGFALAAHEGLITGGGPADDKKRKLLESTGWQPYSVKVGDSYYSFKRIEPLATVLGLAADLSETTNEKDRGSIAEKIQSAIVQNFTDKSWLTGAGNLADALNDPKRYAPQFVRSLEASIVPNIVRKAAQAADPVVRDTKASAAAPIIAGIPGLSQTLPAVTQATGETAERPSTAAERFASPFPRTEQKPGRDLERALLALDYAPGQVQNTLLIPGTHVRLDLTEKEKAVLKQADQATTQHLRQIIASPQWSGLDSETQRDFIVSQYSRGRAAARKQLYALPSFSARASTALRQARQA